jgi:hypothetical protein
MVLGRLTLHPDVYVVMEPVMWLDGDQKLSFPQLVEFQFCESGLGLML